VLRFGGREGLNWRVQFVIFCDENEDRQALPNLRTSSTTNSECFVVSRNLNAVFIHTYLHTAWSRLLLEKLTGFSSSQENPRISWNLKIHCRIHNSLPPIRILSLLGPFHTPTFHFPKIRLNIILPSTPVSPHWLLSPRFFLQNPIYAFPLPHTRYMPHPSPFPFYQTHNFR